MSRLRRYRLCSTLGLFVLFAITTFGPPALVALMPSGSALSHPPTTPVIEAGDITGEIFSTDSLRSDAADTTTVDPLRLGILASASTGTFLAGHVFFSNLWWKGEPVPFRFEFMQDWQYALGADKFGHAIFPYFGTDLYREALEWTGFNRRTSLWIAAGLVWSYMTYIEVRDGFSRDWGFSWGDMAANTLGVGWRVAEEYVPALSAVTWKVSYWPSDAWRAGLYSQIIDDYESTYHWASIDPELFLPASADDWWPDWLNLAVAHTVEDIVAYDGSGSHAIVLALDIDTEGFGVTDPFWAGVLRVLNYYHIPMPAWRIGEGVGLR